MSTPPYEPDVDGRYEFPSDPDAALPVYTPPVAPMASPGNEPFHPPAVPTLIEPGRHAGTPTPPAALAPIPMPVVTTPEPDAFVEASAIDFDALVAFEQVTPTQSRPAPAQPQHLILAPEPNRPRGDIDVSDPRGSLGAQLDDAVDQFAPTTPLNDVDLSQRPTIERLLTGLVQNGGSDMHLMHGEIPRWRVAGALRPVALEEAVTTEQIEAMLEEILTPVEWAEFKSTSELDCAYAMRQADGAPITTRFRINVFRSLLQTGCVMRVIPTKIASLDDLGILPQVKELAKRPRGIILFCGPTGSGKSTSMAGLVDLINQTRNERIFTLEDPVEFTHTSKNCLISHREIGADTVSFAEGLRRVRREDPDIILIGEMRDYETIGAALEAADTGHLVIATLHTNSAYETISRIINSFPGERQPQIRMTLASTLLAVVCQTLVPSPTAERGRVVAQEIMMVTPAIQNNIRENDIPAIASAMSSTDQGSILLDAHLAELIKDQKISRREAERKASSVESLARYLGEEPGR